MWCSGTALDLGSKRFEQKSKAVLNAPHSKNGSKSDTAALAFTGEGCGRFGLWHAAWQAPVGQGIMLATVCIAHPPFIEEDY